MYKKVTVWTPEREAYLRNRYLTDGTPKVAAALGLTRIAVQCKARKLQLRRIERAEWKPEELTYLRENRHKLTIRAMAEHLGRTTNGVRDKVRKMGLPKRPLTWTPEQDADLIRLYNAGNGGTALEQYFGRTTGAIIRRAQHLGLRATLQPRVWNPAKVEEFKGLYPVRSNAELAKHFGVTLHAVSALGAKLKLRKNEGVAQAAEILTKQIKAKARAQVVQKADYRAEKRKPCGLERKAGALKAKPAAPAPVKKFWQYPRGSAEYKAGEAAYFAGKQARTIADQYGRPATVYSNSSNATGRR